VCGESAICVAQGKGWDVWSCLRPGASSPLQVCAALPVGTSLSDSGSRRRPGSVALLTRQGAHASCYDECTMSATQHTHTRTRTHTHTHTYTQLAPTCERVLERSSAVLRRSVAELERPSSLGEEGRPSSRPCSRLMVVGGQSRGGGWAVERWWVGGVG